MNIQEILQEHRIPVAPEDHHHCRDGWVQLDCPFCSPGMQSFRLGINLAYNYANCWACGHHGLFEVLRAITEEPSGKVMDWIKGLEGSSNIVLLTKEESKTGKLVLPKSLGYLQRPHKRFLMKRGFTNIEELESLWQIKGIGPSSRLAWRIFIPIFFRGEIVSWTTRNTDKNSKPISARPDQESMHHKHLLYGEDYTRHTVVVVEGPLDVWAIGPGAVCTFGLNMTPQQVNRIAKYPRRIICLDNEKPAQRVARKLCDDLSALPGSTTNVIFQTGKDASRADKLELHEFRKTFLEN